MSNIFPNTGRQSSQIKTLDININDLTEDSEEGVLEYINNTGIEIKSGEIYLLKTEDNKYLITNKGKGEYGIDSEPLTTTNIEKIYRESIDDKYFVYEQNIPSEEWNINHNLNKKPSVTVEDSTGRVVGVEVEYIDNNNLIIRVNGAFSGKAYLN